MLSDLINNQISTTSEYLFLQMKQVKYVPDTATCMRMIVTDAGEAVNSCLEEREWSTCPTGRRALHLQLFCFVYRL